VQLRLGTRHKKDSLRTGWRNRAESTGYVAQFEVEVKKKVQLKVPQDESEVSVGGMLALVYGRKQRLMEKKSKHELCRRKVD
jgi:hypothetical protein